MARVWHVYNMNNLRESTQILHELQRRWLEVEQIPNLFRYKLNVRKERILDGQYGYIVQLNVERGTQRRPPMLIDSLTPTMDKNAFNFTKIGPEEKLLDIRFRDFCVSILVNHAPITKFNCLLVPKLEDMLPQIVTLDSIEFAIRLLRVFNSQSFMIGYNSPGAAASVNHLHMHMVYHVSELFAQKVELQQLRAGIYSIHPKYEVNAICFKLKDLAYDEQVEDVAERVYKLCNYMIESEIPHNLFFTLARSRSQMAMRIFVFPRSKACVVKNTTELNIAFSEFSGFIPIASDKIYSGLTEKTVIDHIKMQQCDVFAQIVAKVNDSKFYPHRHGQRRVS